MNFHYDLARAALLRFSFFMRLRCHFHLICLGFFHRLELRFIGPDLQWGIYNGFDLSTI